MSRYVVTVLLLSGVRWISQRWMIEAPSATVACATAERDALAGGYDEAVANEARRLA